VLEQFAEIALITGILITERWLRAPVERTSRVQPA